MFTDYSLFVVSFSYKFRQGKQKPLLARASRVENLDKSIYLLALMPSKPVSGLCPRIAVDRPGLNAQPGLNRLWRVAFATGVAGQILADMFMQVFIELLRRYQTSMVTVYLYFWG